MCARYTFFKGKVIKDDFGDLPLPDLTPSWNIAPMDWAPVLKKQTGQWEMLPMRWGLVPGWAEPSIATMTINARSETIQEKPAFRGAFKYRRCIVPANGYYEWMGEGRTKQACYIHPAEGELFHFAGLWEEGADYDTYTIITCDPNDKLIQLHDRMPVILTHEEAEAWVSDAEPSLLQSLLRPCSPELTNFYPVDNKVGRVNEEGPQLIARVEPQRSLFD